MHVYSVLRHCRSFRTLAAHADDMAASGTFEGGIAAARAVLESLCEDGLLVSEREVASHLDEAAAENASGAVIPRLYIPTANRSETAARCVLSHCASIPEETQVCIVDRSRHDPTHALRTGLDALSPERKKNVLLSTSARAGRYVHDLTSGVNAERHVMQAVRSSLLDGYGMQHTYGMTRNLVLLDAAGDLLVSADDDTFAETTVLNEPGDGFGLTSVEDPTDIAVYESFSEVLEHHEFAPRNIEEMHRAMLGCARPAGAPAGAGNLFVEPASANLVRRVLSRQDVGVRATSLGVGGDPGRAGLQFLLEGEPEVRSRYFGSSQRFERALLSESVVRHAPRRSVGDSPHFMTTHIGLDHRRPLPPFFPVGRVVDAVFAQMLLALDPGALVGHLPAAIRHERPGTRNVGMSWITRVAPSVSMYVGLVFQEFHQVPGGGDISDALRNAGSFFSYAGRLPRADLADLLKLHWNRFLAGRMRRYVDLLRIYDGKPGFWAEAVEELIENLEGQLSAPGFPVPVELSGLPDFESVIDLLARLLDDFGSLLFVWPELWSAARELRAGGRGLAQPLFAN